MAIAPIPPSLPSFNVAGAGSVGSVGGQLGPGASTQAPAGFADALQQGLQAVSDLERTADHAIQDVASGGPTSVHELMTSTAKAQLGIEMLTTVRDRAVEAYQEIMRMQV